MDNTYSNQLSYYAEPVENPESLDFDLTRVKLEPSDPAILNTGSMQQSPLPPQYSTVETACINSAMLQQGADQAAGAPTIGPVKTKGKRGRKPQVTAYGKHGEKLERRREQNRRAAATYREKQRQKRKDVETTYTQLEAENARQKKENEELMKLKNKYEAILKAHEENGHCALVASTHSINNNNNLVQCPSDVSFYNMCQEPDCNTGYSFVNNFNMESNVQFQNPMVTHPTAVVAQATKDQTLAPSPFTPKSEQVFLFEGFEGQGVKQSDTPPVRLNSPGSVLSVSPAPTDQGYPYQATPPMPLSSVFGGAQHTLAGPPDELHCEVVQEFLMENMH